MLGCFSLCSAGPLWYRDANTMVLLSASNSWVVLIGDAVATVLIDFDRRHMPNPAITSLDVFFELSLDIHAIGSFLLNGYINNYISWIINLEMTLIIRYWSTFPWCLGVRALGTDQNVKVTPANFPLFCGPRLKRRVPIALIIVSRLLTAIALYLLDTDNDMDTPNALFGPTKHPATFSAPSLSLGSSTDGPFHVTLSVGGMTCSSCSTTINHTVSQLPGVSRVAVSLLEKSTMAVIERRELADAIAEAVEECGFEVQVISVDPVHMKGASKETSRTVSLRVGGMFSPNCPRNVMLALESLGSQVQILKPLTTSMDPVLTLSYQPFPPTFTMRAIISTIASAKSPPFDVSFHRPPSLEQLAKSMQIRERRDLLFRLIFAIIVAIPTFIIGIVYMSLVQDTNSTKSFLMKPMWTGNTSRIEWALFFLATPVMFYSANMFHQGSIKEIRTLWRRGSTVPIWKRFVRFGSMNLLVSTGVSVAYFSSIALLGIASAQPPSEKQIGATTTYFDSVVLLTMFLLAGRFLEAYSKVRTADAITALGLLRPAEALLVVPRTVQNDIVVSKISFSDDLEKGDSSSDIEPPPELSGSNMETIAVDLLEVGDVVRVQNGSTPPADGTIISSEETSFDESSLTGESKLIRKQTGDKVYLGTINKSKMVHIRIDAIGGGTMLDRIVKVVREGQTRRAPIERVADTITGYFVPVVTLLAIITWVIWLSLGLTGVLPRDYLDTRTGGWPVWSLGFAIAVFVVACPCGIGLAAPTALLVGSGLAATFGILARGGGEAFQEMAQIDLVVFDKTGTLTEGGEPRVSDAEVVLSDDIRWERRTILAIAAELESATSHPLAIAIREFCNTKGGSIPAGTSFEETAGRGLKAHFDALQCTAIIGNEAWMQEHEAVINATISQQLDVWKSEAKSVVLLAIKDEVDTDTGVGTFRISAIFAVTDSLRSEAPAVVSWLQKEGIATWMISGDNVTTATAVAKAVGIPSTNVIAGVLPHEKAEKIQSLQQVGPMRRASRWPKLSRNSRLNDRCIVAMVGDGINDAPALTAADVGIAIGSGSDVAISSASFILLSSNLQSLITLTDLSRRVFGRVKFNFLWAVMYNLAALPIAAGVIFPAGHTRLDPVWASLAMALSSVSVVCSSLLLKLYREPKINPL